MDLGKKRVTLLLGGARSGKSRYAQTLASGAGRVLFLATAQPGDAEMQAKIERHRADRLSDELAWTVAEVPIRIAEELRRQGPSCDLAVIDCLTLFAANLIELAPNERTQEVEGLLAVLRSAPCSVVLVSNEVGSGVVPEYASGRAYRDLLGELNQKVAALANDVFLLVAGLPLRLKGDAA